jgi:hypothetical protein
VQLATKPDLVDFSKQKPLPMKEFYLLKSYLYEINDVITDDPELLQDRNVLNEWTTCFAQLEDVYNRNHVDPAFREQLIKLLLKLPDGVPINRKEGRRLIINTVLCLDELVLMHFGAEFWEHSSELRFKAFCKFLDNDFDADAAAIMDNLRLLKDRVVHTNVPLYEKLKSIIKPYRKTINKKIEGFENQNNFNKAQFLNSIYYLHPEYEFESNLQEKEKEYLRMPVFEVAFEIVFPIILLSLLFGINFLGSDQTETNLFYFFRVGNFSFVELTAGFFLIYLAFWLFKVLEYSKLSVRRTIFFKFFTIVSIVLFLQFYVQGKYNNSERRYFPQKVSQVKPAKKEGDINILVSKFTPIEQYSVFDKNYSEIKACNAFYKKMLLLKESSDSTIREQIHIDYSKHRLNIQSEEDFQKIYKQKKYDFVISGDVYQNESETYLSVYCCIVNEDIKEMLSLWKKGLENATTKDQKSNLTLFSSPYRYYELLYNGEPILNFEGAIKKSYLVTNIDYDFQKETFNSFSMTSSIAESPQILLNYIKILTQWHNMNNIGTFDSTLINETQKSLQMFSDSVYSYNNLKFKAHLLLLKAYFINEALKNVIKAGDKSRIADLFLEKTTMLGEALFLQLLINGLSDVEIEYTVKCYWFLSIRMLLKIDFKYRTQDGSFLEDKTLLDLERLSYNNIINKSWDRKGILKSDSELDKNIYESMHSHISRL